MGRLMTVGGRGGYYGGGPRLVGEAPRGGGGGWGVGVGSGGGGLGGSGGGRGGGGGGRVGESFGVFFGLAADEVGEGGWVQPGRRDNVGAALLLEEEGEPQGEVGAVWWAE